MLDARTKEKLGERKMRLRGGGGDHGLKDFQNPPLFSIGGTEMFSK